MKIKTLVTAITLSLAASATPALANTNAVSNAGTPDIQHKAAASGLVVGAIAGGPIGAFVGTVVGGEVFGRLFKQREQNQILNNRVASLQDSIRHLTVMHQSEVVDLNKDLDTLLALQSGQPQRQQIPVQFKTASTEIESQYEQALRSIANLLNRHKDATISLKGFADRRGDDSANLALSEQRVNSIAQFLKRSGVASKRIRTLAYGESRPLSLEESLEDNFFDRRVDVEVHLDIDPQLVTR